jgi:hypothetical protein
LKGKVIVVCQGDEEGLPQRRGSSGRFEEGKELAEMDKAGRWESGSDNSDTEGPT